jgi:hypothetical protein
MINEISAELVGKVNKARTLIKEDSSVAANVTGTGVVGTGDDPATWVKKKKKLRTILTRKELEK